MLFAQTAAPTGWTKTPPITTIRVLRVVTGAASTGGSVDFTTAFASQTPSGSVSVTISGSAGDTTFQHRRFQVTVIIYGFLDIQAIML
jgi:hypothetical protein